MFARIKTTSCLVLLSFLVFVVGKSIARTLSDDVIWQLVQDIAAANCVSASVSVDSLAKSVAGLAVVGEEAIRSRGAEIGRRLELAHVSGGGVIVERFSQGDRLLRLTVQYDSLFNKKTRPYLFAIVDSSCDIQSGRELFYFPDGMIHKIGQLNNQLQSTGVTGLLNPPFPKSVDPGGVMVGLVDSGVNYLLPEIAQRIARSKNGDPLGYDFWEMDRRPFDAHQVRSLFFVRRHGTRTAALLLREAPVSKLVPYRYPRPDMTRMGELIEDAALKGLRIVNLSLGSNKREDWEVFTQHATQHPEILFVVSAGNDGRNIDDRPVFPAALKLNNLIVVTSANEDGSLARGSNWGVESVDLMVPAENLPVTGFDGFALLVSGSSYAAPRVSALAACLLDANPQWDTMELKRAIFSFTKVMPDGVSNVVKVGFIPSPLSVKRGGCAAEPHGVVVRKKSILDVQENVAEPKKIKRLLKLSTIVLNNTGWNVNQVQSILKGAANILAQCEIRIGKVNIQEVDVPTRLKYFSLRWSGKLAQQIDLARPTLFFVKDTVDADAFEALAISRFNSKTRPELRDTLWMMHGVTHPNISLAHELVHVLVDNGEHSNEVRNLMRERTSQEGSLLTKSQCQRIRSRAVENGLLQ